VTARPPRDLRAEAIRALARRLRRAECAIPDALAAELLVVLDGIHIGLTDTRPPADPAADWRPPAETVPTTADSPGLAEYRAARQAQKGQQQ
jgi:hypothetical protein